MGWDFQNTLRGLFRNLSDVDWAGRADGYIPYYDLASNSMKFKAEAAGVYSAMSLASAGDIALSGVLGSLGTTFDITGAVITVPVVPAGIDLFLSAIGYIDQTSGPVMKAPVRLATTAALAANTYANGTAGVGATLTANANAIMANIDGVAPAVGNRILVKNEANQINNGLYTVTQVGTSTTPYILTRATDADTAAEITGATVYVQAGTANAGLTYSMPGPAAGAVVVMGTSSLVWSTFNTEEMPKTEIVIAETTGGINPTPPYTTNVAAIIPVLMPNTSEAGSWPRNRVLANTGELFLSNGNAAPRTFKLAAWTYSPPGTLVNATVRATAGSPFAFKLTARG